MTVAELIIGVIIFGFLYVANKSNEWKSNNRVCPPGKEMDWTQANIDINTKGKEYFYKQHLAGKYDKDKKEY